MSNRDIREAYKILTFNIDPVLAVTICEIFPIFRLDTHHPRIYLLDEQFGKIPMCIEKYYENGEKIIVSHYYSEVKFHLDLLNRNGSVQVSKAIEDVSFFYKVFDSNIEFIGREYNDMKIIKRQWEIGGIING